MSEADIHDMGPYRGPGFDTPAAPGLVVGHEVLHFRCPVCGAEATSYDEFGPACGGDEMLGTVHDGAPMERISEDGAARALNPLSPLTHSHPHTHEDGVSHDHPHERGHHPWPGIPDPLAGLKELGPVSMGTPDKRPTLTDLAQVHGTDKWSGHHKYTPRYEEAFAHLRDEPVVLLELGVFMGASLRMWRDWFSQALIVGLDNVDKSRYADDRISIVKGDQQDPHIAKYLGEIYGPFDIVVDDASHMSIPTITSFELLSRHMRPGGIYCVEDFEVCRVGMDYWHIDYFTRLAQEITVGTPSGRVSDVRFSSGLCIIRFEEGSDGE